MKIVLLTAIVLLAIVIWIGRMNGWGGVTAAGGYQSISGGELKSRIAAGEKIAVVDVRTPEEYAEQHIPQSLSLPLDRLEREAGGKFPDKTVPIAVYCLSGRRSANATGILVKLGYTHIYDLGAMTNWPGKMVTGK